MSRAYDIHVAEDTLARAESSDGTEVIELKEIFISSDVAFISTPVHWVLSHWLMDWDECKWDRLFSDPEEAVDAYVKERERTDRVFRPDTSGDYFQTVFTKRKEAPEFYAMKAEIDRRRNG